MIDYCYNINRRMSCFIAISDLIVLMALYQIIGEDRSHLVIKAIFDALVMVLIFIFVGEAVVC